NCVEDNEAAEGTGVNVWHRWKRHGRPRSFVGIAACIRLAYRAQPEGAIDGPDVELAVWWAGLFAAPPNRTSGHLTSSESRRGRSERCATTARLYVDLR